MNRAYPNFKFRPLIIAGSLLLCAGYFAFCSAEDIRFEATVDRGKVALGDALQLNLTLRGAENIPAPRLDKIDGFDSRYLGPSTMVSIVNGVVTSAITHIYTLVPLKTGTRTIGPFSVEKQGEIYVSNPITVEVIPASSGAASGRSSFRRQNLPDTASPDVNEEELQDRIFLIFSLEKRKIYLNEIIPLTIKLYVNRLNVRDIQFPVLGSDAFSIGKFGQPKQYREEFGGALYDVIEFTADMFAVKPGEWKLGPAGLNCNLSARRQSRRRQSSFDDDFFGGGFGDDLFDDFFGRYELYPLELKSAELPITVLPLPEEGKPEGFAGALGDFRLEVEAAPPEVKAGDPITIKMTVGGKGNFDSVKAPALQSKEGFKVYEPQVKQKENEKIFEQVIIPDSEKITSIPQIDFSFFDTRTGQYRVLTHASIPITVSKCEESRQKLIELPQAQILPALEEELGRDIIYLKSSPGKFRKTGRYLYQRAGFWFFQVLSLFIFAAVFMFNLKRRRLITDRRYARRLQAPEKAKRALKEIGRLLSAEKTGPFFDAVFRTTREYLSDRFHLSAGGITAATVEELAKEKGISDEVKEKIKKIFFDCDMARYAPSRFSREQSEDIFQNLKEIIDYLEKKKI